MIPEIIVPEMRTRGDAKILKKHDDYSESTDSKSADKMLDVARFSRVEARNVRDIMHAPRLQIPCNQKVNLQVDRVAWVIIILMAKQLYQAWQWGGHSTSRVRAQLAWGWWKFEALFSYLPPSHSPKLNLFWWILSRDRHNLYILYEVFAY